MDKELHMTVAAAPQYIPGRISLNHELTMLKAALLYADKVTLVSPAAQVIGSVVTFYSTSREQFFKNLAEVTHNPNIEHLLLRREALKRKKFRNRDEINESRKVKHQLDEIYSRAEQLNEKLVAESGISEFVAPAQKKILDFQPIDATNSEAMTEQYVESVLAAINSDSTYALIDDQTGQVIDAAFQDHKLEPLSEIRTRRVTQPAIMAWMFEELPLFDTATVDEILDIRTELKNARARFRGVVNEYSDTIKSAPWDRDFDIEIEDLYRRKVTPALKEIEDSIKSNSVLTGFIRNASMATGIVGGVIGLAIGLGADPLALLGLPTGLLVAGSKTIFDKRDTQNQVEQSELYFYYSTRERLAKRK